MQARKCEASEERAAGPRVSGQAGRAAVKEQNRPMVKIKPKIVGKGGKQRDGKGFSRDELKKAGTSFAQALKLSIPIDRMRRTAHDENVETVKAFLASAKAASKTKRKPKSEDLKGKSAA